jgi:hypothetical protein
MPFAEFERRLRETVALSHEEYAVAVAEHDREVAQAAANAATAASNAAESEGSSDGATTLEN